MLTVNDVYRKIKEMSTQQWNPRPVIQISNISQELNISREALMPILAELGDMRLIRFNESAKTSLKLTLLGNNVNRTKV
ncbi:MAG TPA: hypothetical protein VN721_07775 [Flavipsychrobacter sp.]|nr:hypothetical protein [Flavipsychrobacter sp.]